MNVPMPSGKLNVMGKTILLINFNVAKIRDKIKTEPRKSKNQLHLPVCPPARHWSCRKKKKWEPTGQYWVLWWRSNCTWMTSTSPQRPHSHVPHDYIPIPTVIKKLKINPPQHFQIFTFTFSLRHSRGSASVGRPVGRTVRTPGHGATGTAWPWRQAQDPISRGSSLPTPHGA